MPKFTLTKFPEVSDDSTISVTFETDSLSASSIPGISEWEWDDDGELRSDLRDRFRIIK